MLQKQMKENGVRLCYNNSSASCLYWFIFRNNTLHLFLVPYPFKIEASLQNSLSLQCTYLCILTFFSVYGLSSMLTRFTCTAARLTETGFMTTLSSHTLTQIKFSLQHFHMYYFSTKLYPVKTLWLQNAF